jgi:hypothetical protein
MKTLERIPTKETYYHNDEEYNWIDYNKNKLKLIDRIIWKIRK